MTSDIAIRRCQWRLNVCHQSLSSISNGDNVCTLLGNFVTLMNAGARVCYMIHIYIGYTKNCIEMELYSLP